MTTITTKEDFDELLRAEQAVLFVFFDWSGQAHVSLQLITKWEHEWKTLHPNALVRFYRLDPDRYKESQSWLNEQARSDDGMEGGYGSVIWLRVGKAVGFVRYAAKAGQGTLSRLTDEHFRSDTPF